MGKLEFQQLFAKEYFSLQHSVASATAGIEDNSEKIVTLEQRRKQLNEQVDARSEQLVESVALLQKDIRGSVCFLELTLNRLLLS